MNGSSETGGNTHRLSNFYLLPKLILIANDNVQNKQPKILNLNLLQFHIIDKLFMPPNGLASITTHCKIFIH